MENPNPYRVHFTLQGKGGVGKSLVSALIAQHRLANKVPLICIDTDPVNATFAGYEAFPVQRLELLNNSKVDSSKFDDLMTIIAENPDSEIVIDNGASSFIPLSAYLIENEAIQVLHELGRQVVLHPVIVGAQGLQDTLTGFHSLVSQMPETAEIVVWLNQYFGDVETKGVRFEDMKLYQTFKERVHGIINIYQQSELFGKDLKSMLEERKTFTEAMASEEFNFMSKNRLKILQRSLFEQMDLVLGVPAVDAMKKDKKEKAKEKLDAN